MEFRLDSMSDSVPVDEQGRMRIPPLFLERAGLLDKGAKAYLVPRRRDGWLEVWNQDEFHRIVDDPTDPWRDSLDRVIMRWREQEAPGQQ